MDRDTLRPVVLALLCVLAIGAAAATLDSTVSTDSSRGASRASSRDGPRA